MSTRQKTALILEKRIRLALYVVLTFLWLKMAYDLLFAFGPESARYWFPLRAVLCETAMALFLAGFNIYLLARLEHQAGQLCMTTPKKLLVVAAFLAGMLSCMDTATRMKFLDMYVIIPVTTLLIVAWSKNMDRFAVRYVLMFLAALLLLPNDKCANPPNWWWINNVNASPLTYALPVNVQLYMTMRSTNKFVMVATLTVVVLYHAGCIFHRWIGRY